MKLSKKNFSELRFPEDISYNSVGNLCYSTDIIESNNLKESRNVNWLEGRMKYNIAYTIKNQCQLKKLINFFRIHKGRAIGFRFKDWSDFEVKEQVIGVSNGERVFYQLFKIYRQGEIYEARVTNKIVANSLKLYTIDEVERNKKDKKKNFLKFEIEINSGLLKLLTPPNKNEEIFVDFEFDVPVRFDNDELIYHLENNDVYSCPNLTLVEIKSTE